MIPGPENFCPPPTESAPQWEDSPYKASLPPGSQRGPKAMPGVQYSSLCKQGLQRIVLTGLLRDILIRKFQTENIMPLNLRRYVWKPGYETGIVIESLTRWKAKFAGRRPAVLIKANAETYLRQTIADFVELNKQGDPSFSVTWVGSHTLFCLAESGAAAEILAAEVKREIVHFSPVIRERVQLFQYGVVEVGAATEIEEAKETFAIPITVGWAYVDAWTLQKEALKLRGVSLTDLLDLQ